MMKRILVVAILLSTGLYLSAGDYDLNKKLPRDPDLVYGVLENGLTYYIMHNEEPRDRVSFYMIQNVGAILETEEQDGLAHFLEHMAFNGLESFPGKAMLNYLQNNGMAFGREINAYTAHNETVYNISNVPASNEKLVDSTMLVLHDWSNYLLLEEEELDAERGVISEEWRTRRDLGFRLRAQTSEAIFKGSKYAERDVIGSLDVIKNFKPQTIKAFYHDWYRTDLQAIAIVGDIDPQKIEARVKEMFSPIPAVENPRPRPEITEIPDYDETRFVLATDEEASTNSVALLILHKAKESKDSYAHVRSSYLNSITNIALGSRLKEYEQKEQPPYFGGNAGYGDFVRSYEYFSMGMVANENKEQEAFEKMYTEVERARRHGFTETEIERAKARISSFIENKYNNRNKISNEEYCKNIVNDYTQKDILTSIEHDHEFVKWALQDISKEDVNARIKEWLSGSNSSIIVQGPPEGTVHMNKAEAIAILKKVKSSDIAAYSEEIIPTSLISEELPGGSIVSEKRIENIEAVEWTLSNDARVVFRHAEYEKDLVLINAFSKGGNSLYEAKDLPSANQISRVSSYGLADFDESTLLKILAGKKVDVNANLGDKYEYLNGSSSVKDVEAAFQLLYLKFEQPRFDRKIFDKNIENLYQFEAKRGNNSKNNINDSLSVIFSDHNPRTRLFNKEYIADLDFEKIEKIYRERFSNAGDFTFYIVGNISEEEAKALVLKYIGSIKDSGKRENWVNWESDIPKGKTEKIIKLAMNTPKANVNIRYEGETKWNRKNKLTMDMISRILTLRYTENIREKEGGTYGVGVRANISRLPKGEFGMDIRFECDPEKYEHLKSLVYLEIDKLIQEGPIQEDIDKVLGNMKKSHEQSKESNKYWNNVIKEKYMYGADMLSSAYFDDIVNNMEAKDIQKFAKKFFKKANLVDVVFLPEE